MRKYYKKKNKPKKNIYQILLVNHGKQLKQLDSASTEKKIMTKFNSMLKENKNVIFPKIFNNLKHVMVEADYELVIIKLKQDGDEEITKVRDVYGKYTNYKSSSSDWIVIDRAHYDIEETFWVYGYHPKLQRKDFNWIFENLIEIDAKNREKFKTVQIYHNKVLIDNSGKLDMVICKNKKDAIRMHNLIQEWCLKRKYKYIAFMGDLMNSKYKIDWMKRIVELTNWSYDKVKRLSTRD